MVAERAMPLLQLRHRPSEISQVKDVDLRGKCNQLGAEPCLLFGRQPNTGAQSFPATAGFAKELLS